MRILVLLLILACGSVQAQHDGTKPQFWNNLGLNWRINDRLTQNNEIAYNFLVDAEYPWSEISYWGNIDYSVYSILEGMGGLYLATTNQSNTFRTNEVRPFLGLRLHSPVDKRFAITNLSRFEWRFMHNTDDGWNPAFRFRNRTSAVVSINNPTIISEHTLSAFGYFEVFSNNEKVVERFFTQLKYKFGLAYRFSDTWRINAGTIFQQSKNTLEVPSQLPTGIVTNVVLEIGATYNIISNNQ